MPSPNEFELDAIVDCCTDAGPPGVHVATVGGHMSRTVAFPTTCDVSDWLFRVRWTGYTEDEDTWEPLVNVADTASEALDEYFHNIAPAGLHALWQALVFQEHTPVQNGPAPAAISARQAHGPWPQLVEWA